MGSFSNRLTQNDPWSTPPPPATEPPANPSSTSWPVGDLMVSFTSFIQTFFSSNTPSPSAPPLPMNHAPNTTQAANCDTIFSAVSYDKIHNALKCIVEENGLHRFYNSLEITAIASDIFNHVDFQLISKQFGIDLEEVVHLASLSLYDTVIYADDSSSMMGDRWRDLAEIFQVIVSIVPCFDRDGIDIHFMNNDKKGENLSSPEKLKTFLNNIRPHGLTPLAPQLQKKILEPLSEKIKNKMLSKPVSIIVITDGKPTEGTSCTSDAIKNILQQLVEQSDYPPKSVVFQFAQIGDDEDASAFLDDLDKDETVGDIVDTTSSFEKEKQQIKCNKGSILSIGSYLMKLLLGSFDRYYDQQDEAVRPSLLL